MTTVFHADDYGITIEQAREILSLSSACAGQGALSSVSIFVNSPSFEECAQLAQPFVEAGVLAMRPHINLVEGYPCCSADEVSLLVGPRGTFRHGFTGLLACSMGPRRAQLRRQVRRECAAQLTRFLDAFPAARLSLALDSHQHTHMVPLVFDALLDAARDLGCNVTMLRFPVESLAPHRACGGDLPPVNLVKDALLGLLAQRNAARVPTGCAVPLFSGVVLSGCMEKTTPDVVAGFERLARERARGGTARDVEVLFHPVSVDVACCLDPQNAPFASACASPGRDAEARVLSQWPERS